MTVDAYPLHWPDGWPRTKNPIRARFDTRFTTARDGLLDEIRRLGGRNIVLSTNIELRRDGLPYSNRRQPEDAGVAVYFHLKGKPQAFACDRWSRVEDNIQAIRKTIEAIRGIERWGSSEIMERVFRGFDALPEPGGTAGRAWWDVLGVTPDATVEEIDKAYRAKVKQAHPDVGGSPEEFKELMGARFQAMKDKGSDA